MGKKVKFEVGDLVVCLKTIPGMHPKTTWYTKNKIYKVTGMSADIVNPRVLEFAENDDGVVKSCWWAYDFKKVPQTKMTKLLYEK